MTTRARPLLVFLAVAAAALAFWGARVATSDSGAPTPDENQRSRRLANLRPQINDSFWSAGMPAGNKTEEVVSAGPPADDQLVQEAPSAIPINPRTNQPFTEAELKAFAELRERFPNNRMIPHVRSQEEIDQLVQREAELDAIYAMMDKGQASPSEVNRYFDEARKAVDDRMEILTYLQSEKRSSYDETALKTMDRLVAMNRDRAREIQEARDIEIKRAESAKPAGAAQTRN